MPEIPEDPITELAAIAQQMHEMYLAYLAAGFTEAQAMQLLEAVVHAQSGGAV